MTTRLMAETRLPRNSARRATAALTAPSTSGRAYSFFIWATLIGIVFPPILISLGSINFTPGRLVAILFLVPSLGVLVSGGRRFVVSDFFAVALATWMLASSVLNGGFKPYVG